MSGFQSLELRLLPIEDLMKWEVTKTRIPTVQILWWVERIEDINRRETRTLSSGTLHQEF